MRTAILVVILGYFYGILFNLIHLSCWIGVGFLMIPLTGVIGVTIFEKAVAYRQLHLKAYLLPNGWLYGLLARRMGILMISTLQATGLALGLIVGWSDSTSSLWAIWLADALLMVKGMEWMERRLTPQLQPEFRSLVVREWVLRLNLMLMIPLWITIELIRPHADYRHQSLAEVLGSLLTQTTPLCEPLGVVMRLIQLKETALWWIAQQTLPELESLGLKVTGWVLVVGSVGLMIWAFSRLVLGLHRLVWRSG